MVRSMLHILDLRGMKCPLPLLRTQKFLKDIEVNEEVIVHVTDPNATDDFEALERFGMIEIVEQTRRQGEIHFHLRRKL